MVLYTESTWVTCSDRLGLSQGGGESLGIGVIGVSLVEVILFYPESKRDLSYALMRWITGILMIDI